jgi:hypothetical protein
MPRFEVKVKRMLDHSTTVTVEAADEDSATEAAVNQVREGNADWELQNEEFEVEDSNEVESDDDEEDGEG